VKIGEEEVLAVARLAQIKLDQSDIGAFAEAMQNVLDLAEQMQTIDTDGIAPLAHPVADTQRLRADVVTEKDEHEKFQAFAPQTENDLYLVPKVIE